MRQLAWRDFYAQLLAERPETSRLDFRPRGCAGATTRPRSRPGRRAAPAYPIIDAGMRQLAREGWMHGRARLLTASFLTKDLALDWRLGAAHFVDLLVDGDVANNAGNWQWVAGTGVDTRPNRIFNPTAQAKRLDPRRRLRAPLRARARGHRGPRRARAVEAGAAAGRAIPSRSSITARPWSVCGRCGRCEIRLRRAYLRTS